MIGAVDVQIYCAFHQAQSERESKSYSSDAKPPVSQSQFKLSVGLSLGSGKDQSKYIWGIYPFING